MLAYDECSDAHVKMYATSMAWENDFRISWKDYYKNHSFMLKNPF